MAKVRQKEYLIKGLHPIIDQGQAPIGGYSNSEEGLFTDVPAIVFGDHTRCVKYIEEPFFAGADGVKILKPVLSGNNRYWYHALRSIRIENLGYSRHFKLLKEASFLVHTDSQQAEICRILDKTLDLIGFQKKVISNLQTLVKSRFIEMFGDGQHFQKCKIADLVCDIVSGTNVSGKQRPLMPGEFGVLKISAVTKGIFDSSEFKVVNNPNSIRKMIHPRKGDLLFSRANTTEMVGATAIVDADYDHLFLPDKLWRLDPNNNVNAVFLKQLLSSKKIRATLSKVSTGTSGSMQNISMAKFKDVDAYIPPLPLQQEFAAFARQAAKLEFVAQRHFVSLVQYNIQ